jgi:hypothetical protein
MTGQGLPAQAASHFAGIGQANGFMPRTAYLTVMMSLIGVIACFFVVVPSVMFSIQGLPVHVPNASFWLSPERRAGTIAFLRGHMAGFGSVIIIFLSYVHWLVCRANETFPASLPVREMRLGLAVFIATAIAWTLALPIRFIFKPK